MIKTHKDLSKYLLEKLTNTPVIKEVNLVGSLISIEESLLMKIFTEDMSIGFYIKDGAFSGYQDSYQVENLNVLFIVGCKKSSVEGASQEDSMVDKTWIYLEQIRLFISEIDITGTNINNLKPVKWTRVIANESSLVFALESELSLTRKISQNTNVYGE